MCQDIFPRECEMKFVITHAKRVFPIPDRLALLLRANGNRVREGTIFPTC